MTDFVILHQLAAEIYVGLGLLVWFLKIWDDGYVDVSDLLMIVPVVAFWPIVVAFWLSDKNRKIILDWRGWVLIPKQIKNASDFSNGLSARIYNNECEIRKLHEKVAQIEKAIAKPITVSEHKK